MKFCPQCGNTLTPGIRFCENCGHDLQLHAEAADSGGTSESDGNSADQPDEPSQPTAVKDLPPPPAAVAQPAEKKRNKGLFFILLAVIILLAGGWFGYQHFMKNAVESVLPSDSTLMLDESTTLDTAASGGTGTAADTSARLENEEETPVTTTVPEPKQNKPSAVKPGTQKKASTEVKKSPTSKKETGTTAKPEVQVKAEPMVRKPISIVFSSTNKEFPKYRNPKNPTRFTVSKKMMITRIVTDHYNEGNGTTSTGSITVKMKNGTTTGTWKAYGKPGSNGTTNGKWVCEPNTVFEPGVYLIQDSEPSTWSKNFFGTGFVEVEGYEVE